MRPRDVGVPHDEWRDAQLDLFLATRELHRTGGVMFGEAGTGVGKTGTACALGSVAPVLYVCQSLALLDQAKYIYGFEPIKGRPEYNCVHPDKVELWKEKYNKVPTAFDCHFALMTQCPYIAYCPYHIAKRRALGAQRAACTYRYLALSKAMQQRRGILVLDECHLAREELLDFSEFKVNEWQRRKWGLPEFPYSEPYGPDGEGDILSLTARGKVTDWLVETAKVLSRHDFETKKGAQAKQEHSKCTRMLEMLLETNWYLECGRNAIHKKKQRIPGIILRSLDARPVAKRLMSGKHTALLMSATIGADPTPLARELGIEEFEFKTYPHPIPAEYRPVYDLQMERMTKYSLDRNPRLYAYQAVKVAKFIEEWDPEWRGIVLTSSNLKVEKLRELLGRCYPDRVMKPPKGGPATRVAAFLADPTPGLISVDTTQGWGHGLDLWGDAGRFAVVAGVLFDNPTDKRVLARRKVMGSAKYDWWKSYMSVPQMCGRVSRGERDEDGNWLLNVAALADGCAVSPRALSHYPKWFKEAIR